MIELELDGVFYRAGTSDLFIKEEVDSFYQADCKGKVVLDLGSHIGFSAVKFAKQGAEKVVCFEPEENNFNLLKRNLSKYPNVYAYNCAVVGIPEMDTGRIYFDKFNNTGNHSMIARNLWTHRMVDCVYFPEVLNEVRPDIIKCDIEGMEYQIFDTAILPNNLTDIMMEAHFFTEPHRELFERMKARFTSEGYAIFQNIKSEADFEVEYIHFKK